MDPLSFPRRIVCLTEEPTEILYALGEEDRIVGISAYTCRPLQAKKDKPVVSAFINGSIQKIKALEPDLVIGFSDIQAQLAKELIAENLQVLIFNQRSLHEILEVILAISRLVGQEGKGLSLIQSYQSRIQEIQKKYERPQEEKPKVYFEEWDDPMICGIQWVSELIEIAGGVDLYPRKSRGKLAKHRFVKSEDVIQKNPDIILASWCGKPVDSKSIMERPGWSAIRAIQIQRIHELDPSIILQPGPACLTAGLDEIVRLLHG